MLTDPCAVMQKLSTGSAWPQAGLCEADRNRDEGERQPIVQLRNSEATPTDYLAGGSGDTRQHARRPGQEDHEHRDHQLSPVCRTNSVFENRPNPKIQMPSDATRH
jgi:hypothetical protein